MSSKWNPFPPQLPALSLEGGGLRESAGIHIHHFDPLGFLVLVCPEKAHVHCLSPGLATLQSPSLLIVGKSKPF